MDLRWCSFAVGITSTIHNEGMFEFGFAALSPVSRCHDLPFVKPVLDL